MVLTKIAQWLVRGQIDAATTISQVNAITDTRT